MPAFIIWGLRVIYRTLGNGVFFCRRCGGDREYRHRTGRRFITVFFIPLIPLTKTGEHVQCRTCKTRYVTEVLKLPTTAALQLSLAAGMRALVTAILRVGDPGNPLARRRAIEAVAGTGERDYDEAALDADLAEPAEQRGTQDRRLRQPAPGRGQGVVPRRGHQDRPGGRPADRRRARRHRAPGDRPGHDPGPGHRRRRPHRAERRPELRQRTSGGPGAGPRPLSRRTAPAARGARSRAAR